MDAQKIPFDASKALAGHLVVNRGGFPVTQLTKFAVENQWGDCLAGVVDGELLTWRINGRYAVSESHNDIFLCDVQKAGVTQ